MSLGNLEVYRRGLDAFNRRDRATWLALCSPEVENVPPREWPESRLTRGRDVVWEFLTSNNDPWEASRYEPSEVIEGDDKVVVHLTAEMRGKASGAEVAWSFWQVVTFHNGAVSRFEWFAQRDAALEAAGLQE